MPINAGGYDPGGAYWGVGRMLWCAWTASGGVIYAEAKSRSAAKTQIEAHYLFADGCTWHR